MYQSQYMWYTLHYQASFSLSYDIYCYIVTAILSIYTFFDIEVIDL